MKVIYYSNHNLSKIYFAGNCVPRYTPGRLQLALVGREHSMTISGDDFIIKKLYDNLLIGVEKNVLDFLLSKMPDKALIVKLYEGGYIE